PSRGADKRYKLDFFDNPDAFDKSLNILVTALETDLPWIREHSRLLQRAMEWEARNRPSSLLLSGSEIQSAEEWVGDRPRNAPEIPALVLEYIHASALADKSRTKAEDVRNEKIGILLADRSDKERALAAENVALKKRLEKYEKKSKWRQTKIFVNYRR